jgi:hypothetical protein
VGVGEGHGSTIRMYRCARRGGGLGRAKRSEGEMLAAARTRVLAVFATNNCKSHFRVLEHSPCDS